MKSIFTNFKLHFLFVILIIFGLNSCEPDKADVIKVIKVPINIEDTLNNKIMMELDNDTWESNSTAKVFFANGGIEFDAAKYIDSSKNIETIKFFIINNKKTGTFFLQNVNPNANFGMFEIYPFSSPIPSAKYTSESGIVKITKQTDSNIVGTFEAMLIDTSNRKKIAKNGKFNLKFVD